MGSIMPRSNLSFPSLLEIIICEHMADYLAVHCGACANHLLPYGTCAWETQRIASHGCSGSDGITIHHGANTGVCHSFSSTCDVSGAWYHERRGNGKVLHE